MMKPVFLFVLIEKTIYIPTMRKNLYKYKILCSPIWVYNFIERSNKETDKMDFHKYAGNICSGIGTILLIRL